MPHGFSCCECNWAVIIVRKKDMARISISSKSFFKSNIISVTYGLIGKVLLFRQAECVIIAFSQKHAAFATNFSDRFF